jgi:pyrimidine deaminase RibD-like protein/RNA-binding protein YhbY
LLLLLALFVNTKAFLPSPSSLVAFKKRSTTKTFLYIEAVDAPFLKRARDLALLGKSHTFPNPAVGCVLVSTPSPDDDPLIIGAGFHPKAGYPHAEVFALLQAARHVGSGVDAALSIVNATASPDIIRLAQEYKEKGAEALFQNCCRGQNVTAYVTLEPCCHYGRTPPCAAALVAAGVSRVVVGARDPNPRVDGGGIAVIERGGIETGIADGSAHEECAELILNFGKRITMPATPDFTGKDRRSLRSIANRLHAEKKLCCIEWKGGKVDTDGDVQAALDQLVIPAFWLEQLDDSLWGNELVLVRLNKAVQKRKQAESIGRRIADQVQAQLVESKGHTVLLFRSALPPKIDWKADVSAEKED